MEGNMIQHIFSRHMLAGSLLMVAALFVAGCDDFEQATKDANQQPQATAPPKLDDVPQSQPATASAPASPAPSNAPATTAPPPVVPATPQLSDMEKAHAGQGVQGQGYGGGLYTEPVSQYFQQRDRIALEIQVPHQLQLWKAEHNNKNPKDKNEFVKEILQPCGITLPDLPAGKQYYYDNKTGDLLVGPNKK
jgi:hypothetical protein